MFLHMELYVKIASRAAPHRFSRSAKPDHFSIINSRRNFNDNFFFVSNHTGASALMAFLARNFSCPMAIRALFLGAECSED